MGPIIVLIAALILIEHLLYLLDVLFVKLLVVGLALERTTELLAAAVLEQLEADVFLLYRVLGAD